MYPLIQMKKLFFLLPLLAIILLLSCKEKKAANNSTNNTSEVANTTDVLNHPSVASITAQINKQPNDANLYFKRGNALRKLEADSLAINDYKKAIALDSTKSEYYSVIGDVLFNHKDIAGSVIWFKNAIKLNPKDPVSHLKFAKMLVFTSKYKEAFEEINTVLRQDPYNPEAYFLKGVIYKDSKDTAKAISSFQTSIQVDPTFRESFVQLGLLFSEKKDPVALKYLDNAFVLDTTDVLSIYAKGMYYQDAKQNELAKEMYKKCILYNPQYGDAYFNTGWILMQQDSIEKALRQFDHVTQIEPNNPEAYYNKGLCNEILKKKTEAINDYKQAITFDKDYQEPKDGLKRLGEKL